ncbi:MAG: CGGC domain-containing protein [Candidatus Aminicenantes bacterium]|nr:CGGC domain-containing protein [Candidatus Aminicenantes bacterium]
MEKIKLGILTCSNTTRILDCPVGACLKDMYERKGAFKEYNNQDIELVGIISCNGCPTIKGAATILPKIETLIHYGANHVHLSYCMLVLCPFVKKYIKVIKDNFPEINLILGTHEPHQTDDKFRCDVAAMLKERRKTIIP